MERKEVERRVAEIVRKVLAADADETIVSDTDLSLVGMDSVKAVNIVVELEIAFNVEYGDEELLFEHFSSIDRMTDTLMKKMSIQSV